ncbi:flagellar motor switch protein FliN [Litoribrevibacter euphylliae]|uniref:Flagellar motor switch protein FliN n=1 Tax=Litoribrevibacter euphylliae TaxID=1834034 RepID=A0ABV7HEV5_9GAMM
MSEEDNKPEGQEENVDQDQLSDEWAAAMEEAGVAEEADEPTGHDLLNKGANEATDGDLLADTDNPNLDVILDIPVTISMEVGNTEISIRNLLQLNQGSVIELDRLAGEPLDVLVNGQLIAHGEVVMVNEKFGIRLTDVVSPTERIKKLR